MIRKNWFVTMLVLVALLLSACQPVMPQETVTAPATRDHRRCPQSAT